MGRKRKYDNDFKIKNWEKKIRKKKSKRRKQKEN